MQAALIQQGLSEVETYSFMDRKSLSDLNYPEGDEVYNAIPIVNPISEEYPDMRTTLFQGLMHVLKYNLAQKNEQVAIFEAGVVYHPKSLPLTELPVEELQVSGLLYGCPEEAGYPNDQRRYDFYDVKGIVENVLAALGIRDYEIRRSTYPVFHPGVSAEFVRDGQVLARFGELHPAAAEACGLKKSTWGFFFSVPVLTDFYDGGADYEKIPRFPANERDLAILVPEDLTNERWRKSSSMQAAGAWNRSVSLTSIRVNRSPKAIRAWLIPSYSAILPGRSPTRKWMRGSLTSSAHWKAFTARSADKLIKLKEKAPKGAFCVR